MNFKPILLFFGAMVLVVLIGASPRGIWAKEGRQTDADGSSFVEHFDQNDDGLISADEFPGPADHFSRLDIDDDGFLNASELLADKPGPPKDGGFEKDDADQDGLVSRSEFGGPDDLFDRLDADGDGFITREEVRSEHPRPGPGEPPEIEADRQ